MYDRLAHRMVDGAVASGIIEEEDREVYLYAYRLLLSHIFTIVSILIIGAVLQCAIPTAIFLLFFGPLRTYAGGIHASTYGRCFTCSLGIYVIAATLCFSLGTSRWVLLVLPIYFVSVCVVAELAPVEDPNKPLDDSQRCRYRRITHYILAVEGAVVGFMLLGRAPVYFIMFGMLGGILEAVLLVLGFIRK